MVLSRVMAGYIEDKLAHEFLDAALTFVDLGKPSYTARPGHASWAPLGSGD
jgi:hypothetical protein